MSGARLKPITSIFKEKQDVFFQELTSAISFSRKPLHSRSSNRIPCRAPNRILMNIQ